MCRGVACGAPPLRSRRRTLWRNSRALLRHDRIARIVGAVANTVTAIDIGAEFDHPVRRGEGGEIDEMHRHRRLQLDVEPLSVARGLCTRSGVQPTGASSQATRSSTRSTRTQPDEKARTLWLNNCFSGVSCI